MARILRFVAEDEVTVRLDLNDPAGLLHGRGLDWGVAPLEADWIGAAPAHGQIQVGPHYTTAQGFLPAIITEQATWDDVEALHQALTVELSRTKNKIEWQPDGAAYPYIIRTYQTHVPPLQRGQDAPSIETLKFDPVDIPIALPRHPLAKRNGVAVFL